MRVVTSSSRDPEVRSSFEMGTGLPVWLSGGRFPGPSATGCQLSASRLCCVSAGWGRGSSRPISEHPRTTSGMGGISNSFWGREDFRPCLGMGGNFKPHLEGREDFRLLLRCPGSALGYLSYPRWLRCAAMHQHLKMASVSKIPSLVAPN